MLAGGDDGIGAVLTERLRGDQGVSAMLAVGAVLAERGGAYRGVHLPEIRVAHAGE